MKTNSLDEQPDCTEHKDLIKSCSELATNPAAQQVCTPSVLSTFINRVTINFPFFGVVLFWAQFAFLGIYLVVFLTTLFKAPSRDLEEEEEEEGLLASTGRRFGAAWSDVTGRARKPAGYGATERDERI
jgi:LMBR1 domain-containing protein 1